MGSRVRLLEGWSTWLIAFGIAQMLLSIAMLAAALLTVFGCEYYFHVSYGVFIAPVLFLGAIITVSGFKCTTRMLTGLGVVSVLFLLVALVAAVSGGVGYYCEAKGADDHDYANGLCSSANGIFGCINPKEEWTYAARNDPGFDDHRMRGKAANVVVLCSAVLYALFAFIVACISFCAESRLTDKHVTIAGGSALGAPVLVATAPGAPVVPVVSTGAAAPAAQVVATAGMPAGGEGINISNVNTANVSTQVGTGAKSTTTHDDATQSPRSSSRSSAPSTQSTRSSRSTSRSRSRPSSRSSSRRSPRN